MGAPATGGRRQQAAASTCWWEGFIPAVNVQRVNNACGMLLYCLQALETATGKTAGANKEAFRAAMVRSRLALPA